MKKIKCKMCGKEIKLGEFYVARIIRSRKKMRESYCFDCYENKRKYLSNYSVERALPGELLRKVKIPNNNEH
jgi:hypothetical protein